MTTHLAHSSLRAAASFNAGLITVIDDWSGVPSITAYRGDDPVAGTGVDPQTIVADYSAVIDVNANRNDPSSFTTGGISEFDGIANPTVAFQGSGAADFPNMVIYVNTLGIPNVGLSFDLRDIDGSLDNSIQQIALQYRLGNSGNFINVAYVADASSGPSLATLVTPISASDPAWGNQAEVQFRILTSNAVGSDEWVGIDNIAVVAVPEPSTLALLGIGAVGLLWRRRQA